MKKMNEEIESQTEMRKSMIRNFSFFVSCKDRTIKMAQKVEDTERKKKRKKERK